MAETTLIGILADLKTVLNTSPDMFDHVDDAMTFGEDLDTYIDLHFVPTMVKRVRAIRWYLRYIVSQPGQGFDMDVLDEIDDVIKNMQATTTIQLANRDILSITDPFDLGTLVNTIVNILRVQQATVIDPYITAFLTHGAAVAERIDSGLRASAGSPTAGIARTSARSAGDVAGGVERARGACGRLCC